MNKIVLVATLSSVAIVSHPTRAHLVGSTTVAAATERLDAVTNGRTAKK